MQNNPVFKILENGYDKTIAEKVLNAYTEIENNYVLEKWKPSELDGGHFVEAVRRIIELELTGNYTPFSGRLSNFNEATLKQYEQKQGHDSFRMLIPRTLKAIYNIRNKRGVGHLKDISPNEMDSTYILYSCKWVLSEIIRLKSNLSIPETQKLIDEIVERRIEVLWKEEGFSRILATKMYAKDKVLVLLYDESPQDIQELQKTIEYKNDSNFRDIVEGLHAKKLLEFDQDDKCWISPKGIQKAEDILNNYKYN